MSEIKMVDFKYCFLRGNTKLKSVVRLQMKRKQTSVAKVCRETGIDPNRIGDWLNKSYHSYDGRRYASQKEILAFCAHIGISLSLKFDLS